MGGGPPRFPPDVTCPAVLTRRAHARPSASTYGALTRCGGPFQRPSVNARTAREGTAVPSGAPVQPPRGSGGSLLTPRGFGLLPVRSPLLRESSLFLGVLRCFSSPGAPPDFPGARPSAGRVAPFGDPRIAGCQRLPGAFRRVATSFVGRQRQGIHRAPIFAAMPRRHRSIPSSGPARAERPSAAVAASRIGFPVPRLALGTVLLCLWCVLCARTGAPTPRPSPSRNGGPGHPAVRGRGISAIPRFGLSRCSCPKRVRAAHRAEDGAGTGHAGRATNRSRRRPPAAPGAPAGRSTPKGSVPRLGPRAAAFTGRRLTWAAARRPRSLERR